MPAFDRSRAWISWVVVLFLAALWLVGCQAAQPMGDIASTQVGTELRQEGEATLPTPLGEVNGGVTVEPTPAPLTTGTPLPTGVPPTPSPPPTSAAQATSEPPPIEAPTATPELEPRRVELEWPPRLRLGDSDIVRLSLVPSAEGFILKTEFPDHQLDAQELAVERPPGYTLYALARLDGVGFDVAPEREQVRLLPEGEAVEWRWTLTPRRPGQQRLAVGLTLRWEPQAGAGPLHESLVYARGLDVQVLSFFGLSRGQAMTTGFFGLFFGGGLSLLALLVGGEAGAPRLALGRPRRDLRVEAPAGLDLSGEETALLQALFRRYTRLVLESEFQSGYSGARAFLARPVRADGRADAHTIVKLGERAAIRREFGNYETFVKHTLPPVTARIQQPPVTVRRGVLAALQYTFIGSPGSTPTSLRRAFLQHPDPALLYRMFETFGPNWWMQRHPYTFRVAQEYDRVLPTYYVVEPDRGPALDLDGQAPPGEKFLPVGERVRLRGFERCERRADGVSYSLRGSPIGGHPPLRVRWLGPRPGEGAVGRIAANRWTMLQAWTAEFERPGLPDPLETLPRVLAQTIAGSRSVIHGDLNLENVLLGPGELVWLIDFAETREGHPLYDFAHLAAQIIAHNLAPRMESPANFLELLISGEEPLLAAVEEIAGRCQRDPSRPGEYHMALFMTCMGALKFVNLDSHAKQALYLTAAHLAASTSLAE